MQYVRSGKKQHLWVKSTGEDGQGLKHEERVVCDGGILKTYADHSFKGGAMGIVRDGTSSQWIHPCDLLSIAGYRIPPDTNDTDLHWRWAASEQVDGYDCDCVLHIDRVRDRELYFYYWFSDDGTGVRLMKANLLIDNDPDRKLWERRFEYRQGSEFPSNIQYDTYAESEKKPYAFSNRVNVSVKSIVINQDVDEGAFKWEFPAGTRVQDRIVNISYVAGGDADLQKLLDDQLSELVSRATMDGTVSDEQGHEHLGDVSAAGGGTHRLQEGEMARSLGTIHSGGHWGVICLCLLLVGAVVATVSARQIWAHKTSDPS